MIVAFSFLACLTLTNGFTPGMPMNRVSTTVPSSIAQRNIHIASSKGNSFKHSSINSQRRASSEDPDVEPQAVATGYSQNPDLIAAIQEATTSALSSLPPLARQKIDLSLVYISSIYDGQCSPSLIVPCVLDVCDNHYADIEGRVVQKLIGCYAGGLIGSKNTELSASGKNCSPIESEGATGVVVSLCILPDTQISTFHLLQEDVPDDYGRISPDTWKASVGLRNFDSEGKDTSFMLLPAPSFQTDLDVFLRGITTTFGPSSTVFGSISSTVSSLSRAKLFRYDVDQEDSVQTLTDGCVGIAMTGDTKFKVMVAQGAKPVGGVYRVVAGQESTIGAIQLDELATEQLETDKDDNDIEEEEISDKDMNIKQRSAAAYAKAAIPKPVLAEANYLMKTLSDDDQAFMRKSILVGLERSGGIAKTPSEILRLAEGLGHRFTVHQVASAGMKDGSVTLPLGSVNIERGARMRFFVRDGEFAKKEVQAVWTGYKKRELEQSFSLDADSSEPSGVFNPAGCLFFPTLDRGQKLFGGNPGFESNAIAECLPTIPSIGGFYSNGVIAAFDEDDSKVMVQGSASCYALVGSKSNRPIYNAAQAIQDKADNDQETKEKEEAETAAAAKDSERESESQDIVESGEGKPAPRSEDGELILKRREIHSGRALTVSAVEWSVAEKIAKPTSALEGFMWEKETEVDRFRERIPLANLLSQCKLSDLDPSSPKPRDWIGQVKAASSDSFVIIPELKRVEPMSGSLRKRYDLSKLTKQFVSGGVPALSVNCDKVLFGGSQDDITETRNAASKIILESSNAEDGVVAPPILASDLILYPYQLYKLRLAGADAVTIIVGALANKDLLYLSKIAASLKMNIVASVTTEVQINAVTKLGGGVDALLISNRDLETFSFDESGAQALDLLKSDALKEFKNAYSDAMILVDGRVGIVEIKDENGNNSSKAYVEALKDAGAMGAIIGSGLAEVKDVAKYVNSLQ